MFVVIVNATRWDGRPRLVALGSIQEMRQPLAQIANVRILSIFKGQPRQRLVPSLLALGDS